MEILLIENCDFLEHYDDSDSKFYAKTLFNIDDNENTHIVMSKISKISALIHKKYNTGGANKLIVHPSLKSFLKTLKSYFDAPIETISCRFHIEYDETIKFDEVYVLYEKEKLKSGGVIKLINYEPFKLDDILDKIIDKGVESLSEFELFILNKYSKQK
jgi:hypothetical protein